MAAAGTADAAERGFAAAVAAAVVVAGAVVALDYDDSDAAVAGFEGSSGCERPGVFWLVRERALKRYAAGRAWVSREGLGLDSSWS